MRTIAHISDVHFGRTDPAVVEGLVKDLSERKPTLLVVSGDFTQRARGRQYAAAAAFLKRLPSPQLVVPGNHDIPMFDIIRRFFFPLSRYRKYITDNLRPAGGNDAVGVEQAKSLLLQTYGVAEPMLQGKTWAMGEDFTLADCAAAPALFYANTVMPFGPEQKNLAAYLDRLMARQSFSRVLQEAEPYFTLFRLEPKPQIVRRTIS